MLNIETYIQDGTVKREKIASDIERGIISKDEIKVLVTNNEVKLAFFGNCDFLKSKPSEWTTEYLNKLSCAAIAECFNEDYLYYLSDVADYVHGSEKAKNRRKLVFTISAAVIVVVAIIVILVVKGK